MPISPQEARKRSTTAVAHLVATYEEVFDAALASSYAGSPITISGGKLPSLPMHLRELTKKTLIEDYRRAGWKVTYHSEQRDGVWWEISELRKRKAEPQRNPRDGGYGAYDQAALDEHWR
jgi:hypothetical protein